MMLRTLLSSMGVYRQVRNAYWRALKRDEYRRIQDRRARLRTFVEPGDLVFDIGANVGQVTSILLDIGARVIAIEPNPSLADVVRSRYGVHVEQCAIGAETGTAMLRLGHDPAHSTVSARWAALHEERLGGEIRVLLQTLEELIEEHGEPRFVKIDVEGLEPEVLQGLERPLSALSFEFQCETPDVTARAVGRLGALGSYRYQYVQNLGDGDTPLSPASSVDAHEILDLVGRLQAHDYGEIYAVRD